MTDKKAVGIFFATIAVLLVAAVTYAVFHGIPQMREAETYAAVIEEALDTYGVRLGDDKLRLVAAEAMQEQIGPSTIKKATTLWPLVNNFFMEVDAIKRSGLPNGTGPQYPEVLHGTFAMTWDHYRPLLDRGTVVEEILTYIDPEAKEKLGVLRTFAGDAYSILL